MASAPRCFRIIAYSRTIAEALGDPGHIVQVEVIGAFKSKAAFARALVEAGLNQTEAQALREMDRSGGETWNSDSVAITKEAPEALFAGSINHYRDKTYIPVPPKKEK
jgi:hypothetical protein